MSNFQYIVTHDLAACEVRLTVVFAAIPMENIRDARVYQLAASILEAQRPDERFRVLPRLELSMVTLKCADRNETLAVTSRMMRVAAAIRGLACTA